jgi:acyl-CoA thioester hydrolase
MSHPSIFIYTLTVPQNAIDQNGHVNNVTFLQWMQDAAIRHGQEWLEGYTGYDKNGTFVAREHRIVYLLPAILGDELEVRTWVNELKRVRAHRRYEFIRKSDGIAVVKGETDWVYVDIKTGRPTAIPAHIFDVFKVLPDPS